MTADQPDLVSGIAWYRREQWSRLREVSADRDRLEDSYDNWLEIAQKAILDTTHTALSPRRVDIDVEDLVAWCRAAGRPVDAAARAEYTVTKLKQEDQMDADETV